MAKAILEYDLDNFDDKRDHLCAIKSKDMASFIWELSFNTRKELEHRLDSQEFTEEEELNQYQVLEMVFEKIHE